MIYLSHLSNRNTYLLRNMYSESKERYAKRQKYPILFQICHHFHEEIDKKVDKDINKIEKYCFIQCSRLLFHSTNVEILFGQWQLEDWLYMLHYNTQQSQLFGSMSNYRNILEQINKLRGSGSGSGSSSVQ